MSRLMITDRDLANFAATPVSIEPDTIELSHAVFLRLVGELRERRAVDLSDADREALRWARSLVDDAYRAWHGTHAQYERTMGVLSRLVERKP